MVERGKREKVSVWGEREKKEEREREGGRKEERIKKKRDRERERYIGIEREIDREREREDLPFCYHYVGHHNTPYLLLILLSLTWGTFPMLLFYLYNN